MANNIIWGERAPQPNIVWTGRTKPGTSAAGQSSLQGLQSLTAPDSEPEPMSDFGNPALAYNQSFNHFEPIQGRYGRSLPPDWSRWFDQTAEATGQQDNMGPGRTNLKMKNFSPSLAGLVHGAR